MKERSIPVALAVLFCSAMIPIPIATAQAAPTSVASNLAGQYAFFLTGQEQISGGATELIAIGGSVTTDSNGNITAGVVDKNSGSGYVNTQTVSGGYQIDSTGKGTFNIVTPAGSISFNFYPKLPLVQGANATRATIVTGGGTLLQASGEIGPASGNFSPVNGNEYDTFTATGETGTGTGSFVSSGRLNFVQAATSPTGTLSGSVTLSSNIVANGVASSVAALVGTYTGPNQPEVNGFPGPGRFTMQLPVTPGSSTMAHYVVYAGNFQTSRYFFLSTDAHPTSVLQASTNVHLQNYQAGASN